MMYRLTLVAVFLTVPAAAQPGEGCPPGTANRQLATAAVRAPLYNTGSVFSYAMTFDGEYEVPAGSGHYALGGMALWVGGKVEGELRAAHTSSYDVMLRPGPLDEGGHPPSSCSPHDRIFVVSREDIEHYDQTGEATEDLRDWPVGSGAPVLDGDGVEGNYNLVGGDRPAISGDEMAWWVMNDVWHDRAAYQTSPIHLEVQASAFVVESGEEALDHATFYRYRLRYMGDQVFDSVYVAHYVHSYLGYRYDNYVGSDTTRNLGFFYNEREPDPEYGVPPAVGLVVLQGPEDDGGNRLGMTSLHHNPRVSAGCNPGATAVESYNLMRGIWCDGTPITVGGGGYMTDGAETTLAFPGDPVEMAYWSQENTDGAGSNSPSRFRRFVLGSGPFRMSPGETEEVVFAVVFAQGSDRLDSVVELRQATESVQAAYDLGELDPLPVANEEEAPGLQGLHLRTLPNPFAASATVRLIVPESTGTLRLSVYDVLGREVVVLADGVLAPGVRSFALDGAGLPAGVYFVRLSAGRQTETLKVLHVE